MNITKKWLIWGLQFSALFFSTPIHAGFYVHPEPAAGSTPEFPTIGPKEGTSRVSDYEKIVNNNKPLGTSDIQLVNQHIKPSGNSSYMAFYVGPQKAILEELLDANKQAGAAAVVDVAKQEENILSLSASWGYQWHYWRMEGNFTKVSLPKYDASLSLANNTTYYDIDNYVLNFNLLRDFSGRWGVRPYVGAGVGVHLSEVALISYNPSEKLSHKETGLAVNILGGLRYHLTQKLWIDAAYRYMYLDNFKLFTDKKTQLINKGLLVGFNYQFN